MSEERIIFIFKRRNQTFKQKQKKGTALANETPK